LRHLVSLRRIAKRLFSSSIGAGFAKLPGIDHICPGCLWPGSIPAVRTEWTASVRDFEAREFCSQAHLGQRRTPMRRHTLLGTRERGAAKNRRARSLFPSRRAFLKYTGATALTMYAVNRLGITQALAQIPGGTLDPHLIPKFRTSLLIPPVMPQAPSGLGQVPQGVDYYEIAVRQFQQQVLPPGG
jgi:hypothetical protein